MARVTGGTLRRPYATVRAVTAPCGYGWAMHGLIQFAHLVRRMLLRLFRVPTRGVKVMLFNRGDELLLIRNAYGNRGLFVFPGGGIGRSESPADAARREVREEVGLEVEELTLVSTHVSTAEGKRDTIFLFTALVHGTPRIDDLEVEEARFFPLDALPATISPAALRRIAEHRAGRTAGGPW
jgi:ADP-ribose pyrophosphatase YjhB (NUDIX family)